MDSLRVGFGKRSCNVCDKYSDKKGHTMNTNFLLLLLTHVHYMNK